MIKQKVLFLCTGNSRRTQMAEGFLRAITGDRFDVMSAGSEETPLDPDAVAAMRDREKERTCPVFPGAIWLLQWDLEDPSKAVTREERRSALRGVRDDIQRRLWKSTHRGI